jgi:hypothetical protein
MPLREEIARRAYDLYETRGHADGHDLDDWFQAEQELQTSTSSGSRNDSADRRRKRNGPHGERDRART